jgi:VWFA-related protein
MRVRWVPAVVLVVLVPGAGAAGAEAQPDEPIDPGVRERTGRRLAQVDVTVHGPSDTVATLTRADFELTVDGTAVDDFLVDARCADPAVVSDSSRRGRRAVVPPRDDPPSPPVAASYLFYFDQAHLTPVGRARAIDLAHKIVNELIVGGARASIVSAAQEVEVFAAFTSDRERLAAALRELSRDRHQWDSYAMLEGSRVGEVQQALSDGSAVAASVALRHAREDRWRTEKALRRLRLVIGRLAELPPPRNLIYFADRMRSRPGEHYLYQFSRRDMELMRRGMLPKLAALDSQSFAAGHGYDGVIREANAQAVRLYTVQAEGLVGDRSVSERGMRAAGGGRTAVSRQVRRVAPIPGGKRIDDAQDSLSGLALETGGRAFLNGVSAAWIARRVRSDLGCFYLLSFDPTPFPEDAPLAVLVRSTRKGVQVRTRSQTVVQSERARLHSRLMSAFAAPTAVDGGDELVPRIVPTSYRDGQFLALVQLPVPGSPLSGAGWDLGVSLISRGIVAQEAAGRVSVEAAGVPVVFETEMRFRPGPYEIVAVAHDTAAGSILTGQVEGSWPDIDDALATVTSFAVLQPVEAAFSREGDLRTSGSVAHGEPTAVRTDRPTALIGLICLRRPKDGPLNVERTLRGADEVKFGRMPLDFGEERCTQLRDIIPADTMTDGGFVYETRIFAGETEIARGHRAFFAVAGD